jgi:hypothetical protein
MDAGLDSLDARASQWACKVESCRGYVLMCFALVPTIRSSAARTTRCTKSTSPRAAKVARCSPSAAATRSGSPLWRTCLYAPLHFVRSPSTLLRTALSHLTKDVGKILVVPAGALPVPVSDELKACIRGLNRQIFWIYCRPTEFYCRPRPAAQLLPISPASHGDTEIRQRRSDETLKPSEVPGPAPGPAPTPDPAPARE